MPFTKLTPTFLLKGDDDTGTNDLLIDPSNNQVLYASMYQRRRSACCMNGGGPGSGIFMSTDGGETWTRLQKGLPEGPLGRIGLDISVDRGATWSRPKSNLPTVRVDEITLHARDNAMVIATHGRGLWILDHLTPIQEYTQAQKTEAKLFTPPAASMFRRPTRDRNYEFWGSQVFYGENPPQAAILSWHLKNAANSVQLRISDATGREVREISGTVLANSTKPGIQSACWDLRVQPNPPAQTGRGAQGSQSQEPQQSPQQQQLQQQQGAFGAGCGIGGGGFGGFGALFAKATPMSATLAKYNLTLTVPGPVNGPVPRQPSANR